MHVFISNSELLDCDMILTLFVGCIVEGGGEGLFEGVAVAGEPASTANTISSTSS